MIASIGLAQVQKLRRLQSSPLSPYICPIAPFATAKEKKRLKDLSTGPGQNSGSNKHIFNIFANFDQDHKLQPDSKYPDWLWTLADKKKDYAELVQIFFYGKGIEDATITDYSRFRKLHNKSMIKMNNARLKKYRRDKIPVRTWE